MSDLNRLADDIASDGVEWVFGIPGSGPSLTLIDSLATRGVEFLTTYMEASAAIMAGVQGRLSGRAGVAIAIKGPGLANMVPGLAACWFEGFPLVAIAEAYVPDTDAAKAHKRMDHELLALPLVKERRFLSRSGPTFAALAACARSEPPGPVLLDIASNAVETQAAIISSPTSKEGDVSKLVDRSERPVVVAGSLAIRQDWSATLNSMNIPVFSTAAAKGVIDETLAHAAGVYTGVGLEHVPEREILSMADLVVGLGLRSNEVLNSGALPTSAINIDPLGAVASPGFRFEGTNGTELFPEVAMALAEKSWGVEALLSAKQRLRVRLAEGAFLPASCFGALERKFGAEARIVLDTGYFCTIGEHAVLARHADRFLGSGQGRYLGIGLPMAVAAALHDSSIPTILAVGDGGIGMFVAELRLAQARRLPLMVVLMSDGGFGSVRTRAIREGLTESPMLQIGGSWIETLAGMGIPAVGVESAFAFENALDEWDPTTGTAFIEARFDAEAYQAMVEGIRA